MNLRKLLTDLGASVGRQAITVLRGLVLIPLITKLIGTDSYGLWASVLGVVSIAAALGSLDLSGALVRYVPRESKTGQTLVDLISMVTAAAVATVAIVAAADVVFGVLPNTSGLLYPTMALVFVRSVDVVVRNFPQALDRVKTYEVLNTTQMVGELVLLSGVLYITRDVVAGLWALVAITLVIDGWTLLYFLPDEPTAPNPSNFRRYLRFSLPMVVQTVSSRTIRHADKYLLLFLLSPTAAGIYAICTEASKLIEDLTQMANPTLFPKVIRAWEAGDDESLASLYTAIFRVFTILGVPAVVGIGVLSRPILATLATETVVERGLLLLPAAAAAFLVTGFNSPLLFIVNAAERNEVLSKSYLGAAVANLGLNVVLIPKFRLFGALAATAFSYGAITAYLFYWTREQVRYRLSLATFVRTAVATGVMAGVLLRIPDVLSFPVRLALYPPIGVVIYAPALYLLGEVDRSEVSRAWRLLREETGSGQ